MDKKEPMIWHSDEKWNRITCSTTSTVYKDRIFTLYIECELNEVNCDNNDCYSLQYGITGCVPDINLFTHNHPHHSPIIKDIAIILADILQETIKHEEERIEISSSDVLEIQRIYNKRFNQ